MGMGSGVVDSINVAPAAGAPMGSLVEIRAIPGQGLEGDRYFKRMGTFDKKFGPDNEVTFIEIEAIEALKRDYGVELSPGDARRNIVTRGVALNHLVGREFQIGGVRFRGLRLCEPCSYLESRTRQGVIKGLIHRGGLRAQILTQGTIRVGDAVAEPLFEETAANSPPSVQPVAAK